MKKVLIILLAAVFIAVNAPIVLAQDNLSASISQQIAWNVKEGLRALDRLFQRSKEAARDAKEKLNSLEDLMSIRDDMKRINEDRLRTTQQILKDQLSNAKAARESALARQRDQQRILKDRLRDLKK